MLARCLAALGAVAAAAASPATASSARSSTAVCPQSGDADAICLSFCRGECDFNSANDTGTAQQISL